MVGTLDEAPNVSGAKMLMRVSELHKNQRVIQPQLTLV